MAKLNVNENERKEGIANDDYIRGLCSDRNFYSCSDRIVLYNFQEEMRITAFIVHLVTRRRNKKQW